MNEIIKEAKPGSQIHQAAVKRDAAATAVSEFQEVVSDIQADIVENRRIVASVDWNSNLATVRDAIGSLAVLEKMREAANKEMKARNHVLYLAEKDLHSLVNMVETAEKLVATREQDLKITQIRADGGSSVDIASVKDCQARLEAARTKLESTRRVLQPA